MNSYETLIKKLMDIKIQKFREKMFKESGIYINVPNTTSVKNEINRAFSEENIILNENEIVELDDIINTPKI